MTKKCIKTNQACSSRTKTDFYRQDPRDPHTYAGRKRPRVRLGEPGDDGKIMTKNRLNTHRVLNAFFIWGLGSVVIGVIAAAAAFFQGGSIDAWSMVSTGGANIQGFDVSVLLRFEALYAIVSGTLFFGSSFLGFTWLYDGGILSTSRKWSILNMGITIGWQAFVVSNLHIVDPVSLIAFVILVCYGYFSTQTEQEYQAENSLDL